MEMCHFHNNNVFYIEICSSRLFGISVGVYE